MTRNATKFVADEAQGQNTNDMEAEDAAALVQALRDSKESATDRPNTFTGPFSRQGIRGTKPQPICSVAKPGPATELVAVCPHRLSLEKAYLQKIALFTGVLPVAGQDDLLKLVSEVELSNGAGRLDYVLLHEPSGNCCAP